MLSPHKVSTYHITRSIRSLSKFSWSTSNTLKYEGISISFFKESITMFYYEITWVRLVVGYHHLIICKLFEMHNSYSYYNLLFIAIEIFQWWFHASNRERSCFNGISITSIMRYDLRNYQVICCVWKNIFNYIFILFESYTKVYTYKSMFLGKFRR